MTILQALDELRRSFWRATALFAYRRWARPAGSRPLGIPGNRDPEHPCSSYEPRKLLPGDWNDCLTDGHFLCAECCHRAPEEEAAER